MSKRRRNDTGFVSNDEILDYLEDEPEMYKSIQLCAAMKLHPLIDEFLDPNTGKLLCNITDSITFLKHFYRVIKNLWNTYIQDLLFLDEHEELLFPEVYIVSDNPHNTIEFFINCGDASNNFYEQYQHVILKFDKYLIDFINDVLERFGFVIKCKIWNDNSLGIACDFYNI